MSGYRGGDMGMSLVTFMLNWTPLVNGWSALVAERRFTPQEEIFALTARCEKCGGYAFLARYAPDAFKRDGTEIWTYECVDCDQQMQRKVKVKSTTDRDRR